ncbi:MAG: acetyl-CoA carboxylase biotin carboxyl carrier protein subunit [Clostridiales bacterium]|nr:acetyl-CoA carboxylase biotin carboxyl carrier protein subunit [Clostridiales bacterium]
MKTYTITVNGNVYNVTVEEGTVSAPAAAAAPVAQAAPAPAPAPAPKAAPAAPKAAPASGGAAGNIKVNSPMPGKIISIKANIGDKLKKGDVILILEAMKMENEIVAPSDGTVASINVTPGQAVEAGTLLATLN